jgi:hypothetical protein
MRATPLKKAKKTITGAEFDAMFDRGEDITPYLDFSKAVVVRRVNVDFPVWMIKRLDQEAVKLNISRQAVIKMWLADRMKASQPKTPRSRAA